MLWGKLLKGGFRGVDHTLLSGCLTRSVGTSRFVRYGPSGGREHDSKIFDALFGGCWHNHYSFPITVRARSRRNMATSFTGTYVVCLDCSKEFPYDWEEMKVITTPATQPGRHHLENGVATRFALKYRGSPVTSSPTHAGTATD
jgi:hypothetical protein